MQMDLNEIYSTALVALNCKSLWHKAWASAAVGTSSVHGAPEAGGRRAPGPQQLAAPQKTEGKRDTRKQPWADHGVL